MTCNQSGPFGHHCGLHPHTHGVHVWRSGNSPHDSELRWMQW